MSRLFNKMMKAEALLDAGSTWTLEVDSEVHVVVNTL